MTWYKQVPKIELHVHLEGAIPHDAMFDLIQKYGGDPSVPNVPALTERFRYKDFSQFIETWSWKNQFLREYEDFTHIAELTAQDMVNQNIRYAEIFFSPSLFVQNGLDVQNLTHAIRIGLSRVSKINIALIADLVRDNGPVNELRTLRDLNDVRNQGVVGIGIGGSEDKFPPGPFQALYEEARQMGFRTTAHAGEAAGAESILEAIRHLRIDRIGHGTRAHDDPRLVDYIVQHRIPVELCPISNVRTGIVESISEHPIREYFKRGLIVSVNTDDPKMFGTSLDEEYRLLEQECSFTKEEICKLILLGVQSSWLPKEGKESLRKSFRADPSWIE